MDDAEKKLQEGESSRSSFARSHIECEFLKSVMSFLYRLKTSLFIYSFLTYIQVLASFDLVATFCDYFECCRQPQIEFNRKSFAQDVLKVHGQPFASTIVPQLLESEMDYEALCFHFHGGTGVGKTFLTKLIIDNIYRHGTKSRYVMYFHLGKDYFNDRISEYHMKALQNTMLSKMFICKESLFVFDGYSAGWFQIRDYIYLYQTYFKKAIFIFISNSNVEELNAYMLKKNSDKSAMHYKDIKGTKEILPFWYIPFLPMTRDDVRQCISDQLDKYNQMALDKEKVITKILDHIDFINDISISGCKKVPDKTDLFMREYISNRQEF